MYGLILLVGILIQIWHSVYKRKGEARLTPKEFLVVFLIVCISGPIFEESLFRHTLIDFTKEYPYYKEFNAVVFSIIHVTNYFLVKDRISVCLQLVMCLFLGYYLTTLDRLWVTILAHSLYNFTLIVTKYVTFYVMDQYTDNKKLVTTFGHTVNKELLPTFSGDVLIVFAKPFRRSKSHSDLKNMNKNMGELEFIEKNKLPIDLLESIDKFSELEKRFEQNGYFKLG